MTAQDPAYFLYHSIGQYPGKAADMTKALSDYAQLWGTLDSHQWPTALAARAEFLDLWCSLIDAEKGSVTSAENVTSALFNILTSLPDAQLRDRKVLIAADCFPSLHFLLNGLAERMGFTLHTVPLRSGAYWVSDDDLIAHWDGDVGLAILTHVTSTASYRSDIARLLAHGRKMGSLVGVDITQAAGILPFSVRQTDVDFAISTSLKWVCGTAGAGILYVNPNLIPQTRPALRGWFSQDNPFDWDLDGFDYAPDARRFENGTPAMLACIGSVPALRWHARQNNLLSHTQSLSAMIIDRAKVNGLTLASPENPDQRGGSVMLRLPDYVHPPTIVKTLQKDNVHIDHRGSIIRCSAGVMTRATHVDALFAALARALNA